MRCQRSEYVAHEALAGRQDAATAGLVLELEPMEVGELDRPRPPIRWPAPKPSRLVRLARFLGLRRGV